jgi:hydrogenase expression/formation protein HypC
MCLAIPARVVAIDAATDMATVALGAVTKDVSLALVDDLAPGDYVLVHVGYALSRISPEEAERTLALMAEVANFVEPPVSGEAQAGKGAP